MIPDHLNSEYEMSKAFDSDEIGIDFDDIIAMALTLERIKLTRGQYSTADSDSDKLETLPSATGTENRRGDNNYRKDETALSALPLELETYPNPLEMNINELTLELKPNDQIHYIFITDTLGKIWYENEIDQFQQSFKFRTDHLPTGSYNILIENDGLFSTKQFIKT